MRKILKICILSRDRRLYSTRRTVEVIENRGHTAVVLDPFRCYVNVNSRQPMVYYRRKALDDFDAIIPRIGVSITYYGTAVLRQFEMMGVYSLNDSLAIARARDKLRSLQILSQEGIDLPVTAFAHSTKMTQDLIKLVGGAPLLLKLLEGSQGKGIVLADTNKAAETVIDAFREMRGNFLVQEFIKESAGKDIRCFVVGNRVVAAMLRKARKGEFRANLHQGGMAENVRISRQERAVAVRATRAMGLNVAGVDLLRSNRGPLVIEVNASPGLEGIETITGVDVARLIIEYIETECALQKDRRGKRKRA